MSIHHCPGPSEEKGSVSMVRAGTAAPSDSVEPREEQGACPERKVQKDEDNDAGTAMGGH